MRIALPTFLKATAISLLFYLVFIVLVVALEFANGIRSLAAAVETGMGAWLVYWFPWHPLALLILLWVSVVMRIPPLISLPIIAIALSLAGANLEGHNLSFYFGVSLEPLVYVGLGWLSLLAATASAGALLPLLGSAHKKPAYP
jgi:hypothetical protein